MLYVATDSERKEALLIARELAKLAERVRNIREGGLPGSDLAQAIGDITRAEGLLIEIGRF